MSLAITGATGQLGRLVIQQLLTTLPPAQLVALARTPAKAADLGVATRAADYSDPASLVAALAGIDTLLLISSSAVGQRVSQHRHVLAAAKEAGVRRLVYTSLLHADTSPLSLAAEHRATEADLQASGLAYTILRNGWYTENYTGGLPGALAGGVLLGSAGEGRIASACRADYAAAAAVVLTTAGHENQTYELAGDEAYTLPELAAELSRQAGRAIDYHDLPPAEYAAALTSFGVPASFAQALASFDAGAAQGALYDTSRQLSALIGRPTTPLATAVTQALS